MSADPQKALRRVLVVAYYFPPMGLSGVQRVAKFVKYLPQHGWQPTVLTVEPAGYFAYDATLLQEVEQAGVAVHRTSSWDPTRLFGRQKTIALPSESRRRWLAGLSQAVFVPDNKIGWLPHAIRRGRTLLAERDFDVIFSSAPPYTAHLVAARLHRTSGLPFIVDFRDDWVGNPRHRYPTPWHRRLHLRLERRILRASAGAITINEPIRRLLTERHTEAGVTTPISVIPQGFDPEDLVETPDAPPVTKMRLLYSGIFYDAQTPEFFLRALAQVVREHPGLRKDVEAVFLGLLPDDAQQLIARLGIDDVVRYEGYVAHDRAVRMQRQADVLWMTIGKRPGAHVISTGKLFEYMGLRKPILALVPEGAAREALGPYGASFVVEPDDIEAIARHIVHLYERWKAGGMGMPKEAYVRQFDRRRLAGDLAACLARSITRE